MRTKLYVDHLLRKHEELIVPPEPWSIPKKGDRIRGICRFDVDPGKTVFKGVGESLRHAYANCVVRSVQRAYSGHGWFVYFNPEESLPVPKQLSEYDDPWLKGFVQEWGGVEVMDDGGWPAEYLPLAAIRRKSFLAAVEAMKEHLDRRAEWL